MTLVKKFLVLSVTLPLILMDFLTPLQLTTANVTDRDGAIKMVKNNKGNLSRVNNSLLDGGYSGEKFADAIKEILGASVEVVKRSEFHKFAVIPKRWVVERSFAWLE